MNENSTHTELLIQYLDGELQGEDLNKVRKIIEENASAREELENLRLAKEASKIYGMKTRIGSLHAEMMQELKTPQTGITRKIFQYSLRIAAVIIVLFSLSELYQYITATPEKLFSENYRAFDLHQTRGSSTTSLEDLYEKGDMADLIQEYNQLKSPQAKDCFLAGDAYLNTHRPDMAIEAYTRMEQINKTNNTHFFEEDAEYFLALGYLANNEPKKALPLFEKIHADPGHPYHMAVSTWFIIKVKKSVNRP
jgi:tetratricopeptide (TPR) repeat protein